MLKIVAAACKNRLIGGVFALLYNVSKSFSSLDWGQGNVLHAVVNIYVQLFIHVCAAYDFGGHLEVCYVSFGEQLAVGIGYIRYSRVAALGVAY